MATWRPHWTEQDPWRSLFADLALAIPAAVGLLTIIAVILYGTRLK